jgi:two-component system CheB/CheR fusion protein
MVSDITERRYAEAQLRESREQLRLIVDNARDYAIFSLSVERRITSWNTGARTILGYTPEEAIGASSDIIFTEEDRTAGAPLAEAEKALTDGRATDERWHVRKNGSRFWGSGVMMVMRDARGMAVGLVKIFRDQTAELLARKAMEQARQELHAALRDAELARDQAEAAGKAKDRFLAVLSHELRAPLTPVLMGAQVLARNKGLPANALQTLQVIERNARLQAHLVDDLLDVTRITHGKMELSPELTELRAAVDQAVEVANPDVLSKNQRLEVRLDAGGHMVWGDAKRLQQVFWNLLKNASKFTPEGGEIFVRSYTEGQNVAVEVRDTGIGFEPEAVNRIFDVFEQVSRRVTARYGGLGLGLSIAEASVKAHGGRITAFSEGPGSGATFTVMLPLASEQTASAKV